jgi:hypothetical protein
MRKLKEEDKTDKTKSMDFGMGPPNSSRLSLDDVEKTESRSRRQMSLDMDVVASPYLMPNAINSSRESFHSMGKNVHSSIDDRYAHPDVSPMSPSRKRDSSVYTRNDSPDGNMDSGLLKSAQRMPTSTPPRNGSLTPLSLVPRINEPLPSSTSTQPPPNAGLPSSPRANKQRNSSGSNSITSPNRTSDSPKLHVGDLSHSPRGESPFADPPNHQSQHGDIIQFRFSDASSDNEPAEGAQPADRKSLAPHAIDSRRISMGFRPLPPEGNPDDTAEERAMRIRSFYKEYFSVEDPSAPPIPQPPAAYATAAQTVDAHTAQYSQGFDDSAMVDPNTGRFVIPGARPFAEPPTRRAMTPPPRMPPRFDASRSRAGSSAGGRFMPPEPRCFSSVSGHIGGPRLPRRPLEAPKPLNLLPTPSMVSEDAFSMPIMFAPPQRVVRVPSDTPSLRGGVRPYSPSVSPHIPLASAFDELAPIPSPHLLRNSSTFTSLDFAPPRKHKNDGQMSDAGSIHSNRSGASALQVHNIRSGAYRVSRIPTDVVPLKDDFNAGLKPTWDLGYGKST